MIVCQCKGITDREIRRAVRQGATTPREVGLSCAAGSDCGGCRWTVERIILAEISVMRPTLSPLQVPALTPAR